MVRSQIVLRILKVGAKTRHRGMHSANLRLVGDAGLLRLRDGRLQSAFGGEICRASVLHLSFREGQRAASGAGVLVALAIAPI